MLQASSRAASSVKVSGPSAGKRRQASRKMSRRAPCGVCAAPRPVRSTVPPTTVAVDPLERLGDGHDRDGRPVSGDRLRDGAHEPRVDQGPGGIVDQDDALVVTFAEPVERDEPGMDGFLAPGATRDDVDDCRRQP